MTTKELIQAELENLTEEDMSELLRVIKDLARRRARPAEPQELSLLSKLWRVQIDGPEDFSANLDRSSRISSPPTT